MTTITKKFLGLSVLAFSLAMGVSAHAQTPTAVPPMAPKGAMMEDKGPMHPEFREEMMKMHQEQEALEAAREKLWEKCVPATKEQVASCKTEREALHQRSVKLMENRKTMHEKMEGMRKEHHEQMEERREERHEHMQDNKMMAPMGTQAPAK